MMDSVVAMDAPMWDGKDMFPEVLSPTKLCEILLTPHGNQLSGLQAGAWALPAEDEGKCSCHGGEEAMEVADQENNTIDCSTVPFGATDARLKEKKEGIKITLNLKDMKQLCHTNRIRVKAPQ